MEGFIRVVDYCANCGADNTFLIELRNEGIVDLFEKENEYYIEEDHLAEIDMFCRWHYELGVNVAGIDAMRHLLNRIDKMQRNINELYCQLARYR